MKTAIATVSISGTLTEKLEAIAQAGFDGIEIFEQDFIAHDGSPRDVGRMIRDHGLEIPLFQPFRDFECLPEPMRTKAFDRAERKFDVMQELETDLVLICSSVHPASLGGIDRAAADLAELGERAKARGLRVGYEALAWGKNVNDHRDAWEIVRRADHPNIGIIVDSFHTLGRGLSPESIRSIPGDKIFFVQLADAPLIEMDLLYWSRHFRNMPGEGDLAVTDFMRAVMATGYKGPISLEIFNDHFRGNDAKMVARDGYRSLIALMDDVHRAEPEIAAKVPALPKRAPVKGTEFIEFAARGKDQDVISALLRSLGFAHVGKHRNKNIDLWQQGDVRFVVNADPEGHAAHIWNTRGLSVCDIGLSVPSANDTAARAKALGMHPFNQPLGPGELDIPAIKGLHGSVLHFVDEESDLKSVWDVEFVPTGETAPSEDLFYGIDHIAQTVSYEDMLSWSLFYTSLMDTTKSPMVDVIDPDGIVRSQVIKSRNGAFTVTLNGAETHRTLAGDFLAKSFGTAVQHIALSTQDIFATAETLAKLGFETLPMPDNYYADLAARFDLSDALLVRIKENNILFEEENGAHFFQFYSKSFAGGMFFEIVQRDPNFNGFGALNAPFRIAAQKRLGRVKGMPAA